MLDILVFPMVVKRPVHQFQEDQMLEVARSFGALANT